MLIFSRCMMLTVIIGPFTYGAEKPDEIRFRPLNESREFTAKELMVHYSVRFTFMLLICILKYSPNIDVA